MSDIEAIRDFLREHDAYALPETYGDVVAALDRLEKAQGLQHTAHTHSVSAQERRYETALGAIHELCGHMPATIGSAVARIVRAALEEEV